MSPQQSDANRSRNKLQGSHTNKFLWVSIHWLRGSVTLLSDCKPHPSNCEHKCVISSKQNGCMQFQACNVASICTGWGMKWYSVFTIKQQCYGWSFCHMDECCSSWKYHEMAYASHVANVIWLACAFPPVCRRWLTMEGTVWQRTQAVLG